MSNIDQAHLVSRAIAAYARKASRLLPAGVLLPQPSSEDSDVASRADGSAVVVLRNCNGPLAEYLWDGRRLRAA